MTVSIKRPIIKKSPEKYRYLTGDFLYIRNLKGDMILTIILILIALILGGYFLFTFSQYKKLNAPSEIKFSYVLRYGIKLIRKLIRLGGQREHITKDEYVDILVKKGFNKAHIKLAYNEISAYLPEYFLIHPDDDLYEDYEIDPEDLSDTIMGMCTTLEISTPPQSNIDILNKEYDDNPFTVAYILKFMTLQNNE